MVAGQFLARSEAQCALRVRFHRSVAHRAEAFARKGALFGPLGHKRMDKLGGGFNLTVQMVDDFDCCCRIRRTTHCFNQRGAKWHGK